MTSPTSLPTFGAPTPLSRIDQINAVLIDLGLQPSKDDDGDLQFVVNEQQLYARASDDGPGLMRVFGQWQISEDLPGDEALRHGAAAHVTASHALVKVNVFEEMLVVALDQIAPEHHHYEVVVPASIDAVLSAVGMWHQVIIDAVSEPAEGQATDGP